MVVDIIGFDKVGSSMKVFHVISSISRQGGGPSRSSQGLVAGLCAAGVEAWLMTLRHGESPWIKGVDKFVNGGSFEEALTRIKPDIVHLHGIWQYEMHRCAAICRRRKIPYIIAPRGMLEPWSLRAKWLKKRIARFLYQDKDLKCAAALHATAESEAEQFRKLGFRNPVVISPNGVNVPDKSAVVSRQSLAQGKKRVLFVSRMHPKKGVLELVEAWGRLVVSRQSSVVSGWECELVYTVSGELEKEYEAKVKARVKELGLDDQFIFTGALNDDEKWKAYGRADLFVLPTYSENFGIVVAEALWAGVPVITTKGTPWSELEEYKCGKWIDLPAEGSNPSTWEALDEALGSVMLMSDAECGEMGKCGRKLVEEKYTWDAVCSAMINGYKEILNG